MLRSIAASKGQLVRKQGELGSPKHESIVSLAETRGFYRQTQPAKCRPCRQESSLILGLAELLPSVTYLWRRLHCFALAPFETLVRSSGLSQS